MQLPCSSADHVHMMGVSPHGCRGSMSWPGGKRSATGRGPNGWGASHALRPLARARQSGWLGGVAGWLYPGWPAPLAPPGGAGGEGAGVPAAGWVCLRRRAAPMGPADLSSGGPRSHAPHERACSVQGQTAWPAAPSPLNTLRPFRPFRRPGRSRGSVPGHRSMPARGVCAARAKVVGGLTVRRRRLTAGGSNP
jgi:hypothetical protein